MENKKPSTTLKVSAGVLKRAVKELEMYTREVSEGEKKLAGLPKDDNFYSQTQQTLEESRTMLKRTQERLKEALADLESKLKSAAPGSPDYEEANEWSGKAKTAISSF
jgi:hypothetical protein